MEEEDGVVVGPARVNNNNNKNNILRGGPCSEEPTRADVVVANVTLSLAGPLSRAIEGSESLS